MSSYIFIELDTRPPEIKIYSPYYTTSTISNKVILESDENLSDFQNIYLIDSANNRYDYTFNKIDSKTLVGEFTLVNSPIGLATIYVELEDEVGNRSKLVSKSINIIESNDLLKLHINDEVSNVVIVDNSKIIKISDYYVSNIKSTDKMRNIENYINTRNITIEKGG